MRPFTPPAPAWGFNPRPPLGRRLAAEAELAAELKFQSAPPVREATRTGVTYCPAAAVSIRAPR